MPKRILVVDDIKDWQLTLSGMLTDEGYEVVTVGSRQAALAAVEVNQFDLAVIDIRLDEVDEGNTAGLDLAGEVKSIVTGLPVIIITGYEMPDMIDRAMKPDEHGQTLAIDFVRKTEANELVDIVNKTLHSSNKE